MAIGRWSCLPKRVMTSFTNAAPLACCPSRSSAPALGTNFKNAASTVEDLEGRDSDLFEELRRHRMEVAREEGVPPYVVASDRTLRDIALLRPINVDELKMAHGIGPSKAERYGDGFIQVVHASRVMGGGRSMEKGAVGDCRLWRCHRSEEWTRPAKD